jgi:DNA-binding GntR family transcriptional regulator
MLGTSDMPVRDALRRLTSEGAFEALPNRSPRIPRLSRLQIEQIYALRFELESRAAGLAAENISKRQLDELHALQMTMEDGMRRRDVPYFTQLNKEFHFRIYAIAGNEPMQKLIEMLWLRMGPLVSSIGHSAAATSDPIPWLGQTHHHQILEAMMARNPAAASEAMRADLQEATRTEGFWNIIEQLSFGHGTTRKQNP